MRSTRPRVHPLSLPLAAVLALATVAAAQPDPGCTTDAFDLALGPEWTLDVLGDATGPWADVVDGRLELSGTGSSLYHGADHGAFLHRTVDGDFRVELDVTGVPVDVGGTYRKGGLMVRGGLDPLAPRVMIQYLPHFPDPATGDAPALQFDVRTAQGATATELASTVVGIDLPVRVAIQRRGDEVAIYYSTDAGASWNAPRGGLGGRAQVDLGASVLAGPVVASYDPERAVTVAFDAAALCQPDDVAPTPTVLPCDPDVPLDWIYLLDVSGSMIRPHDSGFAKLDTALMGLVQLNRAFVGLDDGSRGALIVYSARFHAPYNLAYGARRVLGFTDDFEALGDALAAVDPTDIDEDDTTPAAIALGEVLDLLVEEGQPGRGVVVVWATDNLPNIDAAGLGPTAYTDDDLQAIDLRDAFGDFLPPGQVAWQGDFNITTNTFDGRVVADAMDALIALRDHVGDLRVMSMVPRLPLPGGFAPLLSEDLLDFAAWYTQGEVFGDTGAYGLAIQDVDLLTAVDCGEPVQGTVHGRLWFDHDADGVQDPGEPGVPDVYISIFEMPDTVPSNGGRTDAEGYWSTTLDPGLYGIWVEDDFLPCDAVFTHDPFGGTSASGLFTVNPRETLTDFDFGIRCPDWPTGG